MGAIKHSDQPCGRIWLFERSFDPAVDGLCVLAASRRSETKPLHKETPPVEWESTERRLPVVFDLALVLEVTVVLALVVLWGPPSGRVGQLLTSVIVIGYVFTIPGYALVSALFARRDEPWESIRDSGPGSGERIDRWSRVVLSVAMSPILTGVIVVLIDLSPFSLTARSILLGLSAFVLASVAIAFGQRVSVPGGTRFRPAFSLPGGIENGISTGKAVFMVIALTSALVAGANLSYTAATWEPGERFTELSLLTPGGTEGPVANGYEADEPILVAVGNHEHREMNYTVVIIRQRVSIEQGRATIQEDIDRSSTQISALPHREVRRIRLDQAVRNESDPVRLTIFLYRGSPSQNLTREDAYRSAYLWFNLPNDSHATQPR